MNSPVLSSPSLLFTDILICMPLPAYSLTGLGEKSAYSPFPIAAVLTTHLNVAVLSAAVSASLY